MSVECTCPVCGRAVVAKRAADGYGWEKSSGPLRIVFHAGKRWGRGCAGSDAEYTLPAAPPSAGETKA